MLNLEVRQQNVVRTSVAGLEVGMVNVEEQQDAVGSADK
jgi:hypothetical protein